MPPVLTLTDAAHRFGEKPLFEGISIAIEPRDRLCLVGRNGTGKSTLLKILAGAVEPEHGTLWIQPGIKVVYLRQEPDFSHFDTVETALLDGLSEAEKAPHKAHAIAAELDLNPEDNPATLSGGGTRRLALARAFISEPDVLLLDEPTNHLDLPAIAWLEDRLRAFQGALVIISHDRKLLERVSQGILWLDRGNLHRASQGYSHFEDFSASVLEAEEKAGERLKQHLKAELHWLARGVTARRKRNQGRMRKLEQLRSAKRNQEAPTGRAALNLERGESSGKLVAEVEHVSKSYDGRTIISDFSTRILRGDRIGIIGANGSGKSTLVGLLTGRITPDEGKVKLGTKLDIAHIDQRRADLAEDLTVADILSGGGDFIDVRGVKKHVAGYLKEFLFDPSQLRSPVQSLSGGERNRLLMAKAFAKQVNLVVLDEPTNDLDMDTLDLLEEVLADFDGTVILVSHDRDFLDRVVTSIIALDGKGGWSEHVGGYSDWEKEAGPHEKAKTAKPKKAASRPKSQSKLSYKDARALELLPKEMAALEVEMSKLEARLSEANFYSRDPDGFAQVTETLEKLRKDLQDKEEAWLELELKREELEGA